MSSSKNFFIKKHILSNFTVSLMFLCYLKQFLYFKLKIDPKMFTFKNLEEFKKKIGKNLEKRVATLFTITFEINDSTY